MSQQLISTNTFGTAKWIVSSDPTQGTHTTISAALTSSSSGDTIFIRPGTYTENLTLKAGVNLTAYECDYLTPNVIINGKLTFTTAGTVTISGIQLKTNSDYFLAVTGSSASIINLEGCYLNCLNNTGIDFSSSSSSAFILIKNCKGDVATTGISCFSSTSAGVIKFSYSDIGNSGNSTTANTISSGTLFVNWSQILMPITTSGTATFGSFDSSYLASNATCLTAGGSGVHSSISDIFNSGTASAISVGSALSLSRCSVGCSNTNAITGAGTLNYGGLNFYSSSQAVNTTTQNSFNGGTFTPSLQFGGASVGMTYSKQYGKYYRLDNLLYFVIAIILSNKGSSTGNATLTGLPFASANDGAVYDIPSVMFNVTATSNTYFFCDLSANSSTLSIYEAAAATGGFTQLADTNFSNTSSLYIQGHYFI